ncbi:alpha/beta fold hydrolase [Marilutibacter aestuarii]
MKLGGLRLGFRLASAVAPAAAAARAGRLFGTPMRSSRTRAIQAPRYGAREVRVAVGDHHVQAYAWGDPGRQPYLLFSHGWSSHGTRIATWLPRLRESGLAVVAFDQYAHGLSPGAFATIPSFVEHLLAVAAHFGQPRVLVGHSLGGATAILAMQRGLRADRVVLVAPAADPVDAGLRFAGLIGLAHHACLRMMRGFERRYGIEFARMQAHRVVPALACPALVVHDLRDREVPWCEGERYARHWPGARLLSTEGLGHHRIMDHAGVIDAACAFIQGRAVGERVVSSPNLPFGLA